MEYRHITKNDDYKKIADLIYETDEYIYPAAFKSQSNLENVMPRLLESNSIFNKNNIRVVTDNEQIIAIAVIVHNINYSSRPIVDFKTESYNDVCEKYFDTLSHFPLMKKIYIACICVDSNYRSKGIGTYILNEILKEFKNNQIILETLAEKISAKLYLKTGFKIISKKLGYAYNHKPPQCFLMEYINTNKTS